MMKKRILVLCFTLLLAMTGCGNAADTGAEADSAVSEAENAGEENMAGNIFGTDIAEADEEADAEEEVAEEAVQELTVDMLVENNFILPEEYIVEDAKELPAAFVNEMYETVLNAWKNLDGETLTKFAKLSLEEDAQEIDLIEAEYYISFCEAVLANAEYKALWDETIGCLHFFPNHSRADMSDVLYKHSYYYVQRIRQDCYNGELVVEQEESRDLSNEDALALWNRYREESVYKHSLIDIWDFMEIDGDTGKLSLRVTQPIQDSGLSVDVWPGNGYENSLAGWFIGENTYLNTPSYDEEGTRMTQEIIDAYLRKDVTYFYENIIVPSTVLDEDWKADFDKYLSDAETRAYIQSILDENCINLVTFGSWFKLPERENENASAETQDTLNFFKENNIVVYDVYNYSFFPEPTDWEYDKEFEEELVYWLRDIINELEREDYLD